MGGAVPFGYWVEKRSLHVVDEHAEFVRELFRRYLKVGSVVRRDDSRCRERSIAGSNCWNAQSDGRWLNLSRPYLPHCSEPIYVRRLRHKGQTHDGLHPAIVDHEILDRVQHQLAAQTQPRAARS